MGVIASDVAAQTLLRTYLTQQMDSELISVAGGSLPRVERAGIAFEAREEEEESEARAAEVPLQRVPT
jgi:two-component system OmpR family sensor kinase